MTKLNPRVLQETGISWIGAVPTDWSVHRIKWTVTGCTNGVWGDEPDGVADLVCVRVADFDRDALKVKLDAPTLRAVEPAQRESRKLRRGDLLIEKSGGGDRQLVGCVVQYDHDVDAVCSNFVARMPIESGHCARYWCYAHASLYSGRLNYPAIKQTTGIQNLDAGAYLDTLMAFPPLPEQERIADFLDWKTSQIDELIAKKRELIEKLKEKRLSVITQAVTKGLNLDAPMRDSGAPWLGQIPRHWGLKRMRFACSRIEQGWSPQCENQPADEDGWGVMKVGCVNGDTFDPLENKALPIQVDPLPEYEIHPNDILISRANTRGLLGSAALVPYGTRPKLILCDKLFRLILEREFDAAYLVYYLRTPAARFQYEREATGTSGSMQNIGQDTVKNVLVPVPPGPEQVAISEFLAKQAERVGQLLRGIEDAVARLVEYRSTLIIAAVTGKIDVRHLVIPATA
jgi:type I restriction enzyme, S subunit